MIDQNTERWGSDHKKNIKRLLQGERLERALTVGKLQFGKKPRGSPPPKLKRDLA